MNKAAAEWMQQAMQEADGWQLAVVRGRARFARAAHLLLPNTSARGGRSTTVAIVPRNCLTESSRTDPSSNQVTRYPSTPYGPDGCAGPPPRVRSASSAGLRRFPGVGVFALLRYPRRTEMFENRSTGRGTEPGSLSTTGRRAVDFA